MNIFLKLFLIRIIFITFVLCLTGINFFAGRSVTPYEEKIVEFIVAHLGIISLLVQL